MSYVTMYEDELKNDEARIVSIQTNLTNVCPQHCIMCHKPEWAKIQTGRNAQLDPIHTAEQLNSMPHLETVVLSGGDPMNYPHLQEYIQALKPKLKLGMFTTGLDNAKNRYADLPFERFGYIRFSIDGYSPDTWAKIRGSHPNSYDTAWKNVLLAAGTFERMWPKVWQERIRVQYTIQQENIKEFPLMVQRCMEASIPIYGYWVHDYNVVTESQVEDLQEQLTKLIFDVDFNVRIDSDEDRKYLKNYTNVHDIIESGQDVPRSIDPVFCVIPQLHAFIDTDGSVFPCCYLVGDNLPFDQRDMKYSYGNIYDTPLAEILTISNVKKVRDVHINRQNDICKACCTAKSRYYKMNLEALELMNRRATFL